MLKNILVGIVLFFIVGCDNCDDEVNHLLSDFEKGLIPFTAATTKNFVNQNSETVTGTYSKKVNEIIDFDFSDDEDCSPTNVESEYSILKFIGYNLDIQISVGKDRFRNKTSFYIASILNNDIFNFNKCAGDGVVENIEDELQDITIQGYTFSNVYVFNSCSENSTIGRILYSSANGVEFIEYANGDYLKLDI